MDYIEQSSWLLFLKYLDDLEQEYEEEAMLEDNDYHPILVDTFRWSMWAAPKAADGKRNYDQALTGQDLIQFVDEQLFPYLQDFRNANTPANTIEYKIGEIFSEIKNKGSSYRNTSRFRKSVFNKI